MVCQNVNAQGLSLFNYCNLYSDCARVFKGSFFQQFSFFLFFNSVNSWIKLIMRYGRNNSFNSSCTSYCKAVFSLLWSRSTLNYPDECELKAVSKIATVLSTSQPVAFKTRLLFTLILWTSGCNSSHPHFLWSSEEVWRKFWLTNPLPVHLHFRNKKKTKQFGIKKSWEKENNKKPAAAPSS